ncbi:hypothetical protein J2X04_001688 [Lysobacter niabensis]|uniref:Helix-turn-helix domain-containing protein n=1 Tax=Agrilutibacter niabensis TaxID=380628 RepID=A0ABU1VPC6_9GAMM|nr:hypothetical protein [Lysobacter niabensis]MDR7099341.1 hypothetical protein [Lysobacter niabensis]
MSRKRSPGAERWDDIHGGMAFIIPVSLIRHPNYARLSPWAHKLLADLSTQYSGYNNGYLCAAWTLMRQRGWRSRTTLEKARTELEHFRVIERTQQGGRNRPNLYAFTWRRVDELKGRPKLHVPKSIKPTDAWNATIGPFEYKPKARVRCPHGGLDGPQQAHDEGNH